jgi:hypothetical protein
MVLSDAGPTPFETLIRKLAKLHVEEVLLPVLVQLALIVLVARILLALQAAQAAGGGGRDCRGPCSGPQRSGGPLA